MIMCWIRGSLVTPDAPDTLNKKKYVTLKEEIFRENNFTILENFKFLTKI